MSLWISPVLLTFLEIGLEYNEHESFVYADLFGQLFSAHCPRTLRAEANNRGHLILLKALCAEIGDRVQTLYCVHNLNAGGELCPTFSHPACR